MPLEMGFLIFKLAANTMLPLAQHWLHTISRQLFIYLLYAFIIHRSNSDWPPEAREFDSLQHGMPLSDIYDSFTITRQMAARYHGIRRRQIMPIFDFGFLLHCRVSLAPHASTNGATLAARWRFH